jgi:tetratricopeptide (TPR) repeat protein
MVSTKAGEKTIPEIEAKLKLVGGDLVKIEYLENCLKQIPLANDAARFCHIKLSELYANRLMYGPAAKQLEAAADKAVTYKDKLDIYAKQITFLVKLNDYLGIDKSYKKATLCASNAIEKEAIKQHLKKTMMDQAAEYEKKTKRSNAAQIYERLLQMPITNEIEKKELMAKLASLNSTLGRLKEASRFEQMMRRPIEKPKNLDDDGREVRRISVDELGIEWV